MGLAAELGTELLVHSLRMNVIHLPQRWVLVVDQLADGQMVSAHYWELGDRLIFGNWTKMGLYKQLGSQWQTIILL